MQGWQDGQDVCTLISKLSSLGLNLNQAMQTVIPVFCRQSDTSMCVPSLEWTISWVSYLSALLSGCYISHGVLCEEYVSYRWHPG